MLIDFQSESDLGSLDADLMIVGTGPAGLSIALQFLNSNKNVILLEGGGLEWSAESQKVYEGESIGAWYFPLDLARLRYFGGTSGHWSGWCRPLDPADFKRKAYIPYSGWPISYEDLAPYLAPTHEILDLGPVNYDAKSLPFPEGTTPEFDDAKIIFKPWRFSPPTRFNEKYMETFARSDNVTVFYNANVTNLTLTPDLNRAVSLEVRDYGGKRRTATADYFVLAMGGIETARFLLNCRDQIDAGIGNGFDNVGRYWMEHPELVTADLLSIQGGDQLLSSIHRFPDQDYEVRNAYGSSEAYRDRHQVANCSNTALYGTSWREIRGLKALYRLKRDVLLGEFSRLGDHLKQLFKHIDGAILGGASELGLTDPVDAFTVYSRAEQVPNPDSRLYLQREQDRFGHNRIALDWRLTELDQRTIIASLEGLAEELGRLGIGRLRMPDWLIEEDINAWGVRLEGGRHHMGGLRMSDSPRDGVVDKDSRIHGIDNLYVAGSSVFTTGGYANPTLTVVQLALRLADHLKARLDGFYSAGASAG